MSTEPNNNHSQEAPQWMRDMFEELKDTFEGYFLMQTSWTLKRCNDGWMSSRLSANDRWGGHNGAGRPVLSWRWRLGPARFGSYRTSWGVWGCRIYRPSSVRRFRPRKL